MKLTPCKVIACLSVKERKDAYQTV